MMSNSNSNLTIAAEKPSLECPGSPVTDSESNAIKNMEVKSDDKSAGTAENTYNKLLGREADSIIGAVQNEGKILFMVSWKNAVDTEPYTLLDSEFVKDKYPQLINEYYKQTFQNNPLYSSGSVIDRNDNDTNDIEIEVATITIKTTNENDDDENDDDNANADDEINLNNVVYLNSYDNDRYNNNRYNNNHNNNDRNNDITYNQGRLDDEVNFEENYFNINNFDIDDFEISSDILNEIDSDDSGDSGDTVYTYNSDNLYYYEVREE